MVRFSAVIGGGIGDRAATPACPRPGNSAPAAKLLASARCPAIFVGACAMDATDVLCRFAERLQAPVIMSRTGKGTISSRHPLAVGMLEGQAIWPEVDVAVIVGTRFLAPALSWGRSGEVRTIRIDIDRIQATLPTQADVTLICHADTGLEALLAGMAQRPSIAASVAAVRDDVDGKLATLEQQYQLARVIREEMPDDGIIVTDVTQLATFVQYGMPVYQPRTLITPGFQGTLGYAYPTALGAKVACPEKKVLSISGDGGFMFNVQELSTAVAHGIEASGMTLMPGLVEGHSHITFINGARPTELGDTPPEEHTLIAARNARLLLDHGFTSAYSAASAKLRIDVVIRNAIEAGELPGPRLRACGPEITVTGGLGDERRAHQFRDSFAMFADGPVEVTKLARLCVREGVDSIKLNISGDDHTRLGELPRTVMSEDEVRAGVAVAHDFGRMVNAHCRAAESVKRAVRCGVDVIYHCEHADEEALDLLEAVKDRVFVGPAIGLLHTAVHEAAEGTLPIQVRHGTGLGLAAAARAYPEMKKRGIRVVIGGDYGFARTPQGENARDIAHFVQHLGYSPSEALVCATRYGAELMDLGHQLGQVREGFLADLLLVDGDPVADVSILQHQSRLVAILKGGALHKLDRGALERREARAAE